MNLPEPSTAYRKLAARSMPVSLAVADPFVFGASEMGGESNNAAPDNASNRAPADSGLTAAEQADVETEADFDFASPKPASAVSRVFPIIQTGSERQRQIQNPIAPPTQSGQLVSPSSPLPPLSLAELDVHEMVDAIMVLPVEEVDSHYVVDPDMQSTFRAEVQALFFSLRKKDQFVTELGSPTIRDQAVNLMIQSLLDAAYNSPTSSWMAGLPTGRTLVIVPKPIADMVGFEGVCRVAHERSIRTARSCGKPFNANAAAYYESCKPTQSEAIP